MTKLQKDLQKLASDLSKLEGKKKQIPIGQIRELVKVIAIYEAAAATLYMRDWEPRPKSLKQAYAIAKDVESETFRTLRKSKNKWLMKMLKKEYK